MMVAAAGNSTLAFLSRERDSSNENQRKRKPSVATNKSSSGLNIKKHLSSNLTISPFRQTSGFLNNISIILRL